MKLKVCFSILLVTTIILGCDTAKYSSAHQPLEKYYRFSSGKAILLPANFDTILVYVSEQELVRPNNYGTLEKFTGYSFLKFSDNGMALYGTLTDTKPTSSNIYSLEGQYCFYKIIDNELQLEFYNEYLKKFTIAYFKIYQDKLVFYKDKLRIWWGGKSKHNIVFNKSNIAYTRHLQFPR